MKPCPETSHKLVELRSSNRCRSLGNTSGLWMSVFCWPIFTAMQTPRRLKNQRLHAKGFDGFRWCAWTFPVPDQRVSCRTVDLWSEQSTRFKACVSCYEFTQSALRVLQIAINKYWTICFSSTTTQVSQQDMDSAKHVSRPSAHILCSLHLPSSPSCQGKTCKTIRSLAFSIRICHAGYLRP